MGWAEGSRGRAPGSAAVFPIVSMTSWRVSMLGAYQWDACSLDKKMSHAKTQSRKGKRGKEKLCALATLLEISFSGSSWARLGIKISLEKRKPLQPTTKRPRDHATARPHDHTTKRPNDQTTNRPHDQTTLRPNDRTTKRPHDHTQSASARHLANCATSSGVVWGCTCSRARSKCLRVRGAMRSW